MDKLLDYRETVDEGSSREAIGGSTNEPLVPDINLRYNGVTVRIGLQGTCIGRISVILEP